MNKTVFFNKFRRLFGFVLTISLLGSVLTASAQNARVSIKMENAPISQVMKEIENQTRYLFINKGVDTKNKVSINAVQKTIQDVLAQLFAGTEIAYRIDESYIILTKKNDAGNPVSVTGKIRDANGNPIVGASVLIQGTTVGVSSDADGAFALQVPPPAADRQLEISFIGYNPVSFVVGSRTAFDVTLEEAASEIESVVVTALGIKRSEKAVAYNVQQVKAEDITTVKDANFINSLTGKVAGVTINTSSSGVGGASKVTLRGNKSISQSSNALYVIDGIPMYNFGGGGGTEFDSKGATEAIADINPDDIESISFLTGAAAAAMYGSNAANGAIVVTTKRGQIGKLSATFSSSMEFMNPFVLPKFQNRYGTGTRGDAEGSPILSWGPKLNPANQTGYEPTDFFDTGAAYSNSITLSTGTDKNQTFFSAAAVNSEGMIPNNRYNRYNFTFRNTTHFLNDKMKLDVGASYIIQNDRNMTNQGVYSNPLVSAYLFPRGDDFSLVKAFERYDEARKINVAYWPQGEGDLRMQNPYWIAYRNVRTNEKKRYMLNAGLTYDILDWLNVSARIRVDNTDKTYQQKLYASTISTLTEGSTQGHYTIQTYADFMVNINKRIDDFTVVVNAGTSLSDNSSDLLGYGGPIRDTGVPNVFNVFDLDNAKKRATQEGSEEMTQSIFASAEIGWKSMLYLTLTGRNDWASQLKGSNPTSFFYPSVGLSAVISEMVTLPKAIDYLKVRGSFSSVGTPYPRFLVQPTYSYDPTKQDWNAKTHYPIGKLKPERTDSWEIGVDGTFFKDFKVSGSFYYANTYNQTFDPKITVSSGYSTLYVQTGYVRNLGVEGLLSYGHTWRDFGWNSNFTFSWNKNKIVELVKDYVHPETGEIVNKDRLELKGLGYTKFILKEGGTLGDLYTNADFIRDDKGYIQIDKNGDVAKTDNLPDIKLGSVFPKANLAWNNSFSYKGIYAGFQLSARLGGIVYSATQAALDQYGVSEASAAARDRGGVLVNGRSWVNAQQYYEIVATSSGLPQYYSTYDY